MSPSESVQISKSDLQKVMKTLVGMKYGLLALTMQTEESIGAIKRVMEATGVPPISLPAEGSLPT